MTPLRRIASAALATAALVVSCGAAPASESRALAASPTHDHELRALAGSHSYLVYADFLDTAGSPASTGTLLYRTLHGSPHRPGSVAGSSLVSLAGSMLIYQTAADSRADKISWRNLKSGKHGSASYSPTLSGARTDYVAAAAPDGWIIVDTPTEGGREVLYLQRPGHQVQRLGSPSTKLLSVATSGTTLVTYTRVEENNNGKAYRMSFAHPGTFHAVVSGPSDAITTCSTTNKYIACDVSAKVAKPMRLFSAGGRHIVSTDKHCPAGFATPFDGGLGWVTDLGQSCAPHHLIFVSRSGKAADLGGPYNTTLVAAFGGVVVGKGRLSARGDRKLVFFRSPSQQRTLASAA
jgi:hypothetical protein